ncbi:hypothetical protein Cpir12675_005734 [Ceratocystis pirilliformis]|uniref:Uncharacterized protein n=1 Tax=Ceratocystis pirilliformis TaxID=259994 RepID=A0ABR3YNW7_9PEZI
MIEPRLNAHFRVISPNKVAYIDRTGSGCETIAHAYEPCNARLTLLFISFGRAPRILRLFCTSSVVEWDQPAFEGLVCQVADGKRSVFDGARAVVFCQVFKVQTSCGYGVPMIKPQLYNGSLLLQEATSDEGQAATQRLIDGLSVFADRPTPDNWVAKNVASNTALQYQVDNNLQSLDGLPGLPSAQQNYFSSCLQNLETDRLVLHLMPPDDLGEAMQSERGALSQPPYSRV